MGIVWIKMNHEDTLEAAQNAMQQFNDPRVTQFYDPLQTSGKLISEGLPLNSAIAWDIYLFYEKGVEWARSIPLPLEWMHQLKETDGASKYLCCDEDLVKALHDTMNSLS